MNKGQVCVLDEYERAIVELSANQRHQNKINTGWDGCGTVNENSSFELDRDGFGAEFIFCRELNLYPDFKIHNTSKRFGTDNYDANWMGMSVDVKVNRNYKNPLMIPERLKSQCQLFALFSCIYPRYRFEGFATHQMIFKKENLKMTRVMAYVLDKHKLINKKDLNI